MKSHLLLAVTVILGGFYLAMNEWQEIIDDNERIEMENYKQVRIMCLYRDIERSSDRAHEAFCNTMRIIIEALERRDN